MNTIRISAGQDFSISYDFGTVDITGYEFYGTIKRILGDADTTDASSDTVASGTSATITYTATQTATLATTRDVKYFIDCKIVDTDGNISNIPPEEPDVLLVSPSATIRSE